MSKVEDFKRTLQVAYEMDTPMVFKLLRNRFGKKAVQEQVKQFRILNKSGLIVHLKEHAKLLRSDCYLSHDEIKIIQGILSKIDEVQDNGSLYWTVPMRDGDVGARPVTVGTLYKMLYILDDSDDRPDLNREAIQYKIKVYLKEQRADLAVAFLKHNFGERWENILSGKEQQDDRYGSRSSQELIDAFRDVIREDFSSYYQGDTYTLGMSWARSPLSTIDNIIRHPHQRYWTLRDNSFVPIDDDLLNMVEELFHCPSHH